MVMNATTMMIAFILCSPVVLNYSGFKMGCQYKVGI
jgi:hypothetical protein